MKGTPQNDFIHKIKILAMEITALIITLIALYKIIAMEIASINK